MGSFEVSSMKRLVLFLLVGGMRVCHSCSFHSDHKYFGRTTVSLNGAWQAIVDPFENGKSEFFLDAKPKDKSDRVEYNFDASPVLNVPGDWNTQREALMFYEGPVWYRRLFKYHKREAGGVLSTLAR